MLNARSGSRRIHAPFPSEPGSDGDPPWYWMRLVHKGGLPAMLMRLPNFLSIIAILTAGCASLPNVVIIRDKQQPNSTFTIIPMSNREDERFFAARVERVVMRAELRVLERPPFKYMELKSDASSKHADVKRFEATVDVVAMYQDTTADFIVVTDAGNGSFRIIKQSDTSIVSSGRLMDLSLEDTFFNALAHARFLETTAETRCATVNRVHMKSRAIE